LPSNTSRNDRLLERTTFSGKRQSLWEKSGNEFSGFASLIAARLQLINRALHHSFSTELRNNSANQYTDCLCIMITIILGNEIIKIPSAGLRVNSLGEKTSNAIALCFLVGLARGWPLWAKPNRANKKKNF
jgi:hypothetical protein